MALLSKKEKDFLPKLLNNFMSKKILIIEDDEAIAENLKIALDGDYEIYLAANALTGLNLAKEKTPDLILLDYILPDMNGLEVIRQLREEEIFREIPIVVLTNVTDTETVSGIMESGVKDYWPKAELSIERVVKKVREMLD